MVKGGVCGRRCAWWGDVVGSMHGADMCGKGGVHGRVSVHGRGACVAGEMATVADGMHPTGMHSCQIRLELLKELIDYLSTLQ